MELKTFAEDDFDAKKIINKAWSESGNQDKEAFVVNAVSRLQLFMKQLTNALDEATTQIVMSLPRVQKDAAQLHEEGLQLQEKLLALEQKVHSVEEQTGHSIESLQCIDKLKVKLEVAATFLHEADMWAALTSSLEKILENGVPASAEKLTELSIQVTSLAQCLEVLSDSSDYDSKRVQLETLYNRLEAALSPPLINALSLVDAECAASYVSVFRAMGRVGAACVCWRRATVARLSAPWRSLDVHSLVALTRLFAENAFDQFDWVVNVLQPEYPRSELVRLFIDMLLSLNPSPSKIVSANLKLCKSAEDGVLYLIDVRRDIDEYMKTMKRAFDAPVPHPDDPPLGVQLEFGRTAYAPLRDLLPHYTDLQSQLLLNHLNSVELKQNDVLEHSRAILGLAERCEGWFEAAYTHSKKIAGVAGYPYYLLAVENFLTSITSIISAHSRRIEAEFLSSVSSGRALGVLSDTFAASLVLESASATLLSSISNRHKAETREPDVKDVSPVHEIADMSLAAELGADTRQDVGLSKAASALRRAKEHLATLALNILKEPVETQLDKIPTLPVWSNNDALTTDLPDFALSPQEYITEIGQYLITLPQHLEMHFADKNAPWQYLSEVCVHTCVVYEQKIHAIRNMDELGTKRCLADIMYLSSVVEDLGTTVTPTLMSLENSLRFAGLECHGQVALGSSTELKP